MARFQTANSSKFDWALYGDQERQEMGQFLHLINACRSKMVGRVATLQNLEGQCFFENLGNCVVFEIPENHWQINISATRIFIDFCLLSRLIYGRRVNLWCRLMFNRMPVMKGLADVQNMRMQFGQKSQEKSQEKSQG